MNKYIVPGHANTGDGAVMRRKRLDSSALWGRVGTRLRVFAGIYRAVNRRPHMEAGLSLIHGMTTHMFSHTHTHTHCKKDSHPILKYQTLTEAQTVFVNVHGKGVFRFST